MLSPFVRRRLLFLGYKTGLQIWDCTNLGSVTEVLNLTHPTWGAVESAAILPPPPRAQNDAFRELRPLLGIM